MQLSQMLFARITGVPAESADAADAQQERRIHGRVAFDQRARILPLMEGAGDGGMAVLIRDISVVGIGLLSPEPLGIGDEFVIRFNTKTEEPIDIQCATRRCELGGTGGLQFAVGATFELVLNRPLSTSVAPESEVLAEAVSQVQSDGPTISQRYDQQCETARLLRPAIEQTKLERWLDRPTVKRLVGVISFLLRPFAFILTALRRIAGVWEVWRIRSRLAPRKGRRRSREAQPSQPAAMQETIAAAPSPMPAVEVAPVAVQQNVSGHRSLFTVEAPLNAMPTPISVEPIAAVLAEPVAPVEDVTVIVPEVIHEAVHGELNVLPVEPEAPAAPVVDETPVDNEQGVSESFATSPSTKPESNRNVPTPKHRPPSALARRSRRRSNDSR